MKYYRLYHTNNEKIVGKYEQVMEGIYNFNVKDEYFIGNIKWHLKKIEFIPLVPDLILWKKAKITDMISVSIMGTHGGLVISDKLKNILQKNNYKDVQFFPIGIYKNDSNIGNYWFMRFYKVSLENINFNNSEVWEYEHTFHKIAEHKVSSKEEFLSLSNSLVYPRTIHILTVALQSNISDDSFALNFIMRGGIGYFVSEKLKKEIEKANCTGIIFKDINEKYP